MVVLVLGSITVYFEICFRLLYGWIMDKTAYKIAMSIEAFLLTVLVATLPLTSYIGTDHSNLDCNLANLTNTSIYDAL